MWNFRIEDRISTVELIEYMNTCMYLFMYVFIYVFAIYNKNVYNTNKTNQSVTEYILKYLAKREIKNKKTTLNWRWQGWLKKGPKWFLFPIQKRMAGSSGSSKCQKFRVGESSAGGRAQKMWNEVIRRDQEK